MLKIFFKMSDKIQEFVYLFRPLFSVCGLFERQNPEESNSV